MERNFTHTTVNESTAVTPPLASRIITESRDKPPKKHWLLITLLVILVLFLAGITSVYAYFMHVPNGAIEQALFEVNNIESYRSKTNISMRILNSEEKVENTASTFSLFPSLPLEIYVTMDAAVDASFGDKKNYDIDLSIVASEEDSQNKYAFNLKLKQKDDIFYFNLADMPVLGMFDMSFLLRRWISLDMSDIAGEDSIGGMFLGLNDVFDKLIEKSVGERKLQQNTISDRITELVQEKPIFEVSKVHLPKFSNGKLLTSASYELNTEVLISHLETVLKEFESENKYNDENFAKEMREGLKGFGSLTGTILFDKKSNIINNITFNTRITYDDINNGVVEMGGSLSYYDTNNIIIIEALAQSTEVKSVMEEFMVSMFGMPVVSTSTMSSSTFDTGFLMMDNDLIDTDGDGLSDYDEINYWFTDPNNPDTDGDGYLDGEEVNAGYNPLGPGLLFENR